MKLLDLRSEKEKLRDQKLEEITLKTGGIKKVDATLQTWAVDVTCGYKTFKKRYTASCIVYNILNNGLICDCGEFKYFGRCSHTAIVGLVQHSIDKGEVHNWDAVWRGYVMHITRVVNTGVSHGTIPMDIRPDVIISSPPNRYIIKPVFPQVEKVKLSIPNESVVECDASMPRAKCSCTGHSTRGKCKHIIWLWNDERVLKSNPAGKGVKLVKW